MNRGGSSNQYVRAEALFQRAVDLPDDQRETLLAIECADDIWLRGEVEELLAHYAAADNGFLCRPVHGLDRITDSWRMPERIGGYRVVRVIDQGGCGVVFEAQQENPRRRVAIKVIRPGITTPESLRRFEHEATILGQLRHAGIAHVYEAGVAEVITADRPSARQPFFAMEFVQGRPLLDHVRTHRLDTESRLALLCRICDAVEYAHRKGVIHRDLKPTNILVTNEGDPKVLDFGVARVTHGDVTLTTMHTDAAQVIGTLPYMSPEQIAASTDSLDTRSDVYALGVILYELIAERLPYDLAGKPLAAAARVINDELPVPLEKLNRAWRGDVDTIVRKALEKDPECRYPSAHALAADVRRYLDNRPIVARPASVLYQLRKFTQRNRAVVAGIVATLTALLLGVIGTSYGLLAMTRERNQARLQSQIVQEVNAFLTKDLLAQANPNNEPDRDIQLREVLDRAAARIEQRFTDVPLVEAAIRQTLGNTYRELGELATAEIHLRRALDLTGTELGENDRAVLRVMLDLGETHRQALRYDEAGALWQSTADLAADQWGPDDPVALEARSDLGILAKARGELDEGEAILRDVLERRRRTLGKDHGATLVSMNLMATTLQQQGRFDEAEALYIECVERSRRILGNEHPDTMVAISNLGLFYSRLDRFEVAEPLCVEALELRRGVLGEEHPETLIAMNNLAYMYCLQNRFDECEPLFKEVYAIRGSKFGPDHPDTLLSMHNLGWLYMKMQQWEDAEPFMVGALEITRRAEPDSIDLALATHAVGALYAQTGRYQEAEPLLHEALAGLREKLPDGDWRIGGCASAYGNCLRGLKRFSVAERFLLEGHSRQRSALGPNHQQTLRAVEALINLYTDWGRPKQAGEWQALLARDD